MHTHTKTVLHTGEVTHIGNKEHKMKYKTLLVDFFLV